jgi:hypothetical protein
METDIRKKAKRTDTFPSGAELKLSGNLVTEMLERRPI